MARQPTARRIPGSDRPIVEGDAAGLTIINAVRECKREASDARRTRLRMNRENRRAYLGIQDWEHKRKGQSKEFLPKTPVAVEQFVGFAKRALTQFGDYFEVILSPSSMSPLSGTAIRNLINCFFEDLLVEDNTYSSFPVQITNALKVGALESLIILKVHGSHVTDRRFVAEAGEQTIDEFGEAEPAEPTLTAKEYNRWQLRIDLIAPENYYPDPTGAGLYEIHSCERDFHYLQERADRGVYDAAAVAQIKEDFRAKELEESRMPQEANQDDSQAPQFRKKARIDEFWGTLLDSDGNVIERNVFCAVANDKYLIRPPQPNPFWHQESPFVAVPLIRVPFSTWHKAIFDHATRINFALNEFYNLIIDGGISAVWGIKQLRIDDLDDPRQVVDGIPQGETLIVKGTLPHNAKVLETVSEGQVPPDSMAIFEMLSREFAASALSHELKLGSLPAKQVKATEITSLDQSQDVTMDGVISDIERDLITKTIRKAWLTILQNMDDVPSDKVIEAIGLNAAFALSKMSPAERFATMAGDYKFRVFGLSQMMSRTRDFQKIMAMIQAVSNVPMLMAAFFKRYSPDRVLSYMMKLLGVNPEHMARDDRELAQVGQELAELPFFQQLASTGRQTTQQGSPVSAESTGGGPELPAEIASVGNPTAGLAGVGGS